MGWRVPPIKCTPHGIPACPVCMAAVQVRYRDGGSMQPTLQDVLDALQALDRKVATVLEHLAVLVEVLAEDDEPPAAGLDAPQTRPDAPAAGLDVPPPPPADPL